MQIKVRIGLVAAALVAMLSWWSLSAEEAARVVAVQPEQADAGTVAAGKALYARHCSHCHGFNMVNPGTISYDLRKFPHDELARFVQSVTHGKNGRMPQWGDILTLNDIDDLWAYVKTGGKQ